MTGEILQASVVIPSYHRPRHLEQALASVLKQTGFGPGEFEIIVVDNSTEHELKALFPDLPGVSNSIWPVRLVHELLPGVAHARNSGVAHAKGSCIAFLDDDELADPAWLSELLAIQRKTGADVVFGLIQGRLENGSQAHPRFVEEFFSRDARQPAGLIDDYFGTGNSLISRAAFARGDSGFDPARGHTGGEDDVFFSHLHAAGGTFAWSPHALVYEMIPPERGTRRYMRMRGFMIGQGPPVIALNRRPPDYLAVFGWMCVGLAQIFIHSAIAAFFRLLGNTYRADRAENRMMQGFGKFFWMDRFRPRLYGIAAALLPHAESMI